MPSPRTIEIWSDVACPWCAVGRARLQQALDGLDGAADVAIRWRSFELDPRAPRTREGDYADLLAAKYRTDRSQAQAMIDRMTATAAAEGLAFDFSIIRPGNTFDAHRVLHLAADAGDQDAVKERFLRGYLGEGAAIGDPAVVQDLAVEAGLDAAAVADVLDGDRYATAVREDEARAHELGIGGVPFFVLDGRIGVSGAQDPEVLRQAIRRAWPSPALEVVGAPGDAGDGDACGIDGC